MTQVTHLDLEACTAFLKDAGAATAKHTGRSLLTHLQGTHRILCAAGADRDICAAGLFHSVYGTDNFKPITIEHTRRQEVSALIGPIAESYAWLFGQLRRPSAIRDYLTGKDAVQLRSNEQILAGEHKVQLHACSMVEAANLLEQQHLWRHEWLHRFARLHGLLTDGGMSPHRVDPTREPALQADVMLSQYKALARREVDQKLHPWAADVSPSSPGQLLIQQAKLAEAIEAAQQADMPEGLHDGTAFPLLNSLATARGLTLIDAAAMVVAQHQRQQESLYACEQLRDRWLARIDAARSTEDVGAVRSEVRTASLSGLHA